MVDKAKDALGMNKTDRLYTRQSLPDSLGAEALREALAVQEFVRWHARVECAHEDYSVFC